MFLDGGRNLTHCGKCAMQITGDDRKCNNSYFLDTNRFEYDDDVCEKLVPKLQIVHHTCPRTPQNSCTKCKRASCECTCGEAT